MLEYIGWLLYHIFKSIILETIFMGLARLLAWPGFRLYSLYTKEWSKSYRELRDEHTYKVWPYIIGIIFWGAIARIIIG